MTVAALDDYQWLTSEAGAAAVRLAAGVAGDSLALATRLRREFSPPQVHLVLEQLELRRRGREKFFDLAEQMFFTRRALEQATDCALARYKASRFPAGALVYDLCCGLGGDSLALASRGPLVAVDRDPIMAHLANANLQAVGQSLADGWGLADGWSSTEAHCGDALVAPLSEAAAWHIDPDRRPSGGRTTRVELHEPNDAQLEQLLMANPQAAIKLAPAAHWPERWTSQAEWQWLSRGGECRQLVAWFGALAEQPGQRVATLIDHAGQVRATLVGPANESEGGWQQWQRQPFAALEQLAPGDYVYEPDAAVLAARLVPQLAEQHDLRQWSADVAYLVGDRLVSDPALAGFQIEAVLPLDVKRLHTLLRARQIGRLEIKQRGTHIVPEQLRRELKLSGNGSAVLIAAPGTSGTLALVAHRCAAG